MDVKVLKDETVREVLGTTVEVDKASAVADPKYVIEAVALEVLGLKPSHLGHLWPHYVARVRGLPLVPCIKCGAASEASNVLDNEGPVFLINRTRTLNRDVSRIFKIAKTWTGGSVAYTRESECTIINGFCEACIADLGDRFPQILRLDIPESEDIQLFRSLVAKVIRQGRVGRAINALRKIVDPPTGSIGG